MRDYGMSFLNLYYIEYIYNMPFRKIVRKRRPRRIRRRARVPRPIRGRPGGAAQIYNFKRNISQVINVGTPSNGWLLNTASTAMYATMEHKLSDLVDNSDFKNLFRYFKINAVRIRIWNANTAVTNNNYTGEFPNAQLMLRWMKNQDGNTTGSDNPQTYMDSQIAKVQNLTKASGRPIDLFYKVKQSNMIYQTLTGTSQTAYNLQKPKWIDTETGGNASHYGLNMLIQRCDNQGLSTGFNNQQTLRFDFTYYIQCKQVQ